MNGIYVQYGAGPFSGPDGWLNFDSSPRLRVQRLPVIGPLLAGRMALTFASAVKVGDVLRGLPGVAEDSCDGIYCSHVLEHLAYEDCLRAIEATRRLLKPGGLFRCVVPDLEGAARKYVAAIGTKDPQASHTLMADTLLGRVHRSRGLRGVLQAAFGSSTHLYMWDEWSLTDALRSAGFTAIRRCSFNDSSDPMFLRVEEESRFEGAVAVEASK